MADFLTFCNDFSPLEEAAVNDLIPHTKTRIFQKGDIIVYNGEVCRHLFFINSGLTKICSFKHDKEFIMRFFSENVMFSVFESFLTQTPSNFEMIALEPTTLTLISYDSMEILCQKHHSLETFFRKLVARATVKMTKRISEMLEENATTRYHQFVNENNHIIHRISLGDMARYLGITQQSLSRIRAQK
ncbi:Crp/Fnr family transcriptional regulator [Cytophagaceae bacterium YF14B1]|uniref:Crp/Fnr family transcriptional regulator n=1 Tax=Xanthocytophaga flava TaxID=3048013 RepID=A0AAE3QT19_9BACT|nr:Crp/Fnr family transcriptional regulator [Xanthocytophaga flavus]MDJ1482711.1 Crp/Fnr family transcriptional regulator [Xanthocytophaga flavus]